MKPLALVAGVGPGTGRAIVERFAAGGYAVGMLARDKRRCPSSEHLAQLAAQISGVSASSGG